VADVLYIAGAIAFFALMITFVFRYDRSAGGGTYEVPGAPEEANGRDEHVAHPV
jgi:hypothetical protein